ATLIEPTAEQQKLTKTGVMTGTPAYMSPEQCRGEKATIASDVYSLACIIYEMLLGAPPFQGETALQTMSMHLNQTLK
ncbi:protein kinase, partial [Staphylococcus equorum]|uniref:protein kinase domain-containing protein n=1 Tax=Staphylococcus equorum TaxID=246432 RepID=UPI0022AE98B7